MNWISWGEVALMAALGAVVLVALTGVVSTVATGMRRLPGRPLDDGRPEHLSLRAEAGRRDRTTPVLLVGTFVGLNALIAVLLVWGDGLDVWAYVVTAAGLLVCWLIAVVTIHQTRASPEA